MGAGDRKELVGPPIIYENPYTGTPLAQPASTSASSPYGLQSSPRVSWGATKKHSVMWVESQWNIEGEVNLYPGSKVRALSVITLKGLGASLSGDWWVDNVTYSIQNEGLTVTAHVLRDAYGKDTPEEETTEGSRKEEVTPSPDDSTGTKYTLKPGDSLWTIANRVYGNGNQFDKIAKANNLTAPYILDPGTEIIIP
jgi:hypothetical protein